MSLWKRICCSLAAAAGLNAHAGDYTDLWWNPQESGWGMNVVQQLETAFVTLFVYGQDGKPAWYSASDARVIAYTAGGLPLFSGTLVRTTGSWQGGQFDPGKTQRIPVGTITMEALSKERMRVEYTADGATVSKVVERLTFDYPMLASNFRATLNLRNALPGQAPFGTLQYAADVLVHFDTGAAFIRIDDDFGRRCEYRGSFEQSGKLAKASGDFTCLPGASGMQATTGTFALTDVEVTTHGFTAYLRTFSPTLNEYGRLAALRF